MEEESMNEKIQINIYKGLPMVLEKVKLVALAAVTGKSAPWMLQKMNRMKVSTKESEFVPEDLPLINNALVMLGDEIAQSLVVYSDNRSEVVSQIKALNGLVFMPYIYTEHLKVSKSWFTNRTKACTDGFRVVSFKEDDIFKINMAAMRIANELRSIEFTL